MGNRYSYTPEMKARALAMLAEAAPNYPSMSKAFDHVAGMLGMSRDTLRGWWRRETGDPNVVAVKNPESEELRRLRRENAELRRANEILKTASAFFAAELDHRATR
jgi:transposase